MMDIHDKFVKDMQRYADSYSFVPAVAAARFSSVDFRTQVVWIGLLAETLYYIQANPNHEFISDRVKEFIEVIAATDFSSEYARHTWR